MILSITVTLACNVLITVLDPDTPVSWLMVLTISANAATISALVNPVLYDGNANATCIL